MTRIFWRNIAVVVLLVAAAAAGVVYLLQPAVGWPDATRRVRHPAGFSIAKPIGWVQELFFKNADDLRSSDGVRLVPETVKGRLPYLYVNRLSAPPDEAALLAKKYVAGEFQGQPALVFEGPLGHNYARSAVFERDGKWYEVIVSLPRPDKIVGGVWGAYLDSFKLEPALRPIGGATTHPATTPSAPAVPFGPILREPAGAAVGTH